MFAVIFKAKIKALDAEYASVAQNMRERAMTLYGCKEFTACTEGDNEIAISYWETEAQIKQWKSDTEHLLAQEKGRAKWYQSYSVQIVEIKRVYSSTM